MADITIPDEAVEAAYMSFTTNLHDSWRDELRAAIAAALKAWPNAVFATEANTAPCIYLPLPLEKTNGH